MSRVSWMRYGHHLFEGIVPIWGLQIESVRSLSDTMNHDIVQIRYRSGMNVILEFIKDISLPIQLTCFCEESEPFHIYFQDFYFSFREMMKEFACMVQTGKKPIHYHQMIQIAKVVLAGDISKQRNGISISPETLNPLD